MTGLGVYAACARAMHPYDRTIWQSNYTRPVYSTKGTIPRKNLSSKKTIVQAKKQFATKGTNTSSAGWILSRQKAIEARHISKTDIQEAGKGANVQQMHHEGVFKESQSPVIAAMLASIARFSADPSYTKVSETKEIYSREVTYEKNGQKYIVSYNEMPSSSSYSKVIELTDPDGVTMIYYKKSGRKEIIFTPHPEVSQKTAGAIAE